MITHVLSKQLVFITGVCEAIRQQSFVLLEDWSLFRTKKEKYSFYKL